MELIRDIQIAAGDNDAASVRKSAQYSFQQRRGLGNHAKNFQELSRSIAALRVARPHWRLVYRGQRNDYSTRYGLETGIGKTTLHPRILRPYPFDGGTPSDSTYCHRLQRLKKAEKALIAMSSETLFGAKGMEMLKRYRCLRWALLQHYEICRTPVLDVTTSLLVATSFATAKKNQNARAFVYVLAIPWGIGAVQTSVEEGLQTIDLSLFCPPEAPRPHVQEGLLLAEHPELTEFELEDLRSSGRNGRHHTFDFARRLVAKFWIDPYRFWEASTVGPLSREFLSPKDTVRRLTLKVKAAIKSP